jgi:hypothetical protein
VRRHRVKLKCGSTITRAKVEDAKVLSDSYQKEQTVSSVHVLWTSVCVRGGTVEDSFLVGDAIASRPCREESPATPLRKPENSNRFL